MAHGVHQRRVVLPVAEVRQHKAHCRANQHILPVVLVVTGAGNGDERGDEQGEEESTELQR